MTKNKLPINATPAAVSPQESQHIDTFSKLLDENAKLKQQVARLSALPQVIRDEIHYHVSALDSDILFESAKKEIEALRLRADMLENACKRYESL